MKFYSVVGLVATTEGSFSRILEYFANDDERKKLLVTRPTMVEKKKLVIQKNKKSNKYLFTVAAIHYSAFSKD